MSESSNHGESSDVRNLDNDGNNSFGSVSDDRPSNLTRKEGQWDVGDRILDKYKDTQFYYEAEVIYVTYYDDQPVYKIHYPEWGHKYDAKVLHEDAVNRFMEYTEENRRKSKAVIDQASQPKKRKLRTSEGSSGGYGKGSSSKKLKKSRGGSPSVTDTPLSFFKSKSRKVKPKVGEKLPLPNKEKKMSLPDTEEKSPKTEKDVTSPKTDKDETLPKAEKDVTSTEAVIKLKPISLPDKLEKIITEDRQLVVEEDMLPKLPAVVPVKKILEQYIESLEKSSRKEGKQFSQIILDCFKPETVARNVYLFEVGMVEDLLSGKSGFEGLRSKEMEEMDKATGIPKDFVTLFGVAYILRLLNNFHTIASKDNRLTQKDLEVFANGSAKFVEFLNNHADEYFQGDKEYYPASVNYCARDKLCC